MSFLGLVFSRGIINGIIHTWCRIEYYFMDLHGIRSGEPHYAQITRLDPFESYYTVRTIIP